MAIPDFQTAEYNDPQPFAAPPPFGAPSAPGGGAFLKALLFGIAGAAVGAFVYGLTGLSGFYIGYVAIGVAWLIGKAMMTGSGGLGGMPYRITACVLTYLAVSGGEILDDVWSATRDAHISIPAFIAGNLPLLLKYVVIGPFMDFTGGGGRAVNGVLGLLILVFAMRTAWRMGGGGQGFGAARTSGSARQPFRLDR